MINAEKSNYNKNFPVKKSVEEVLKLAKLNQKEFIYSIKVDLPDEVILFGNKIIMRASFSFGVSDFGHLARDPGIGRYLRPQFARPPGIIFL